MNGNDNKIIVTTKVKVAKDDSRLQNNSIIIYFFRASIVIASSLNQNFLSIDMLFNSNSIQCQIEEGDGTKKGYGYRISP